MIRSNKISLVRVLLVLLLCSLSLGCEQRQSLDREIGQMLIVGFDGTYLADSPWLQKAIDRQTVGGVVLFDESGQEDQFRKNIRDPDQLVRLTRSLQNRAYQAAHHYNNRIYPLFIAIDQEGGLVNRLKTSYGFPPMLSAAKVADKGIETAREQAKVMSETLAEMGVNFNLAPVLGVNVNPDSPGIGRVGRSFSDKPQKVAHYAQIYSQHMRQLGIMCAYKHFPGLGSARKHPDHQLADVSDTWQSEELKPYKILFRKPSHCQAVMTTHVVNKQLDQSGDPATLSRAMVQNHLRNKLGFDGLVITDDLQSPALTEQYNLKQRLTRAINAGSDLLLLANQNTQAFTKPSEVIEIVKKQVARGRIKRERIDEAYRRIMRQKRWLREHG